MAKVAERPFCGFIVPRIGCLIIGWIEVILIMPLVLAGFIALGWAMFGSPWCLDVEQQTKTLIDADGLLHRITGPVCVDQENWPNSRGILALVALIIFTCCGLLLSFPCCLLYGVNNKKPGCMIPYMVFGIIKASILLYFLVMLAIYDGRSSALVAIFGHFVTEIYKTSIVRSHYHHLIGQQEGRSTDIWRELEDRSEDQDRRAKVAIIDSQYLNNNTGYMKLADKPN